MRHQLKYYLRLLGAIPMLPVLYYQGKKVRKEIVMLPEAEGLSGSSGNGAQTIRILLIGESSFAGVGVAHNDQAIAGHLSRHLSEKTGRTVTYDVLAKSGYTAKMAYEKLLPQLSNEKQYDFIFIGLGVNESFKLNPPNHFKNYLTKLILQIKNTYPDTPVIVSDLPLVDKFLALPPMLRRFMGSLNSLHRNVISTLPKEIPDVYYNNGRVEIADWIKRIGKSMKMEDFFCEDGIHPSEITYREWAYELVAILIKNDLLKPYLKNKSEVSPKLNMTG